MLVGILAGVPAAARAQAGRTTVAGLTFVAPGFWQRVPAGGSPVVARWVMPRFPGDPEDGQLVVLSFGAGTGGGAQEMLERWYGEFAQRDGRPSREAAAVKNRTIGGLKVSTIDLGGTYSGKPEFRMLGAIVEGEGGPWFIRALGPESTISEARLGFGLLLSTLQRAP